MRGAARILLQNRENARSDPGGDTVVMERYAEELRAAGLQVDVSLGATDPAPYDLVHLFNFATPEKTLTYARAARSAGVPYVVTALYEDWPCYLADSLDAWSAFEAHLRQGESAYILRWRLEQLGRTLRGEPADNRETARHAACLLASGTQEAEALRRDYADAPCVEVLHFGADGSGTGAPETRSFDQACGVRDYVLCVGRLETRKNQLMLLQALKHDPIPIVFLTGGFTYQPEYGQACRDFPRAAPVRFVGYVEPGVLRAVYAGARVLAMPSWWELPGLVALEAAREGCPVVASNRGTLFDYLGDAVHYCDAANPESLRLAIFQALTQSRSESLVERSRAFTWRASAEGILGVYSRVLRRDALSQTSAAPAPRPQRSARCWQEGSM